MKIVFEWDRRKAQINRQKHNVSFEEASSIFFAMTDKPNEQVLNEVDAGDDMLPEYDLSNRSGERGKYYEAL